MAEVHERQNGGINVISIVVSQMAKHPEICLLLLGITLNFIANHGTSLKPKEVTAPPKPPKRFFPAGSQVLDFPYGTLSPLSDIIIDDEIIFVMYYAPWCSESIQLRAEFQKAARVMQSRVHFVALNCWWPEGTCRHNYKFYRFPEFYAYHTHLNGFRYTGPRRSDYIVKFLENLIYPLKLLQNSQEILEFVAKHDNALVGFFDFHASPQPPGYTQFYYTAMRLLELDPLQPVRCAIISKEKDAVELGMTGTKQFVFVRTFNQSLLYPSDNNFTSTDIQMWVEKHKQKPVVTWIAPPGYKSLQLSSQLEKGPALIMFAPVNQLSSNNHYLNLLREVGLHYMKCTDDAVITDMFIKQSINDRIQMKTLYEQDRTNCRLHSGSTLDSVLNLQDRNCCISLVDRKRNIGIKNHPQRICEFCRHIEKSIPLSSSSSKPCTIGLSSFPFQEPVFGDTGTPMCLDLSQNYNTQEYRTLCCRQCSHEMPAGACLSESARHSTDSFIVDSFPNLSKTICKKLSLQKFDNLLSPYDVMEDFSLDFVPENFTGLSCRTNRTLNLFFLDIDEHSLFLERVFIEREENSSLPSVIIVDKQNEAHFVLRKSFSRANIANLIVNFTESVLPRHLSTESLPSTCDRQVPGVCIQDLSTTTFQEVVMQQDKDVILLIYATWCGFCAALSHTYITLAKYFKSAQDLVFTRINGDVNDLPWEYTVDHYPSIIFFPAHRKADSVVFPDHISKSLPNLIRFVLAHSSSNLRLETAADVCTSHCIKNNLFRTRLMIRKLRKRKSAITRRIKSLRPALSDKPEPELDAIPRGTYRVLWKIMNSLQRKIKSALAVQRYLSESKWMVSKEKLQRLVVDALKYSKTDNAPAACNHDEL